MMDALKIDKPSQLNTTIKGCVDMHKRGIHWSEIIKYILTREKEDKPKQIDADAIYDILDKELDTTIGDSFFNIRKASERILALVTPQVEEYQEGEEVEIIWQNEWIKSDYIKTKHYVSVPVGMLTTYLNIDDCEIRKLPKPEQSDFEKWKDGYIKEQPQLSKVHIEDLILAKAAFEAGRAAQ